jgi:hypothetical protein
MAEEIGRDGARRLGELEGEAFDRALARREERERQERLSALVLGGDSPLLDAVAMSPSSKPRALEEAERRIEELAAFQRALFASKGWRAMQALRRLAGRSW